MELQAIPCVRENLDLSEVESDLELKAGIEEHAKSRAEKTRAKAKAAQERANEAELKANAELEIASLADSKARAALIEAEEAASDAKTAREIAKRAEARAVAAMSAAKKMKEKADAAGEKARKMLSKARSVLETALKNHEEAKAAEETFERARAAREEAYAESLRLKVSLAKAQAEAEADAARERATKAKAIAAAKDKKKTRAERKAAEAKAEAEAAKAEALKAEREAIAAEGMIAEISYGTSGNENKDKSEGSVVEVEVEKGSDDRVREERRAYFRVGYNPEVRPRLKAKKNEFEVLDISEKGLRFVDEKKNKPAKWVSGTLMLLHGQQVDIQGKVITRRNDEIVLSLLFPIAYRTISREQRYVNEMNRLFAGSNSGK